MHFEKQKKIRIVAAPDSFKGSISADEAAQAIKKGLLAAAERAGIDARVTGLPIADGGEGTLDALRGIFTSEKIRVTGPDFTSLNAEYGVRGDTVLIEMANAAGFASVPPDRRRAALTTTCGVGELISHAIDSGRRDIVLTVGGSATNDGGCGMASALGARFFDRSGTEFIPTGGTLGEIADADFSGFAEKVGECRFAIAADVRNPLTGENGASRIYAPQKGATPEEIEIMEDGMSRLAALVEAKCGRNVSHIAGCGAGGGLPLTLLAFAEAKICSGICTVLDMLDFDSIISDCDLIVTGEGRLDRQSLCGKAVSEITRRGMIRGIPVYCIAGCAEDEIRNSSVLPFARVLTLSEIAPNAGYSMSHASDLLERCAGEIISDFFGK